MAELTELELPEGLESRAMISVAPGRLTLWSASRSRFTARCCALSSRC